ncbi:alpha-1,2-fucosyltransferase [Nocardioides KLBMP 9356]|uniref:Alpha-1,2-fucosyltransferase n=1 Tax=Nocardioides potassii TaxID=2911371 RepID=A0ABS9H849_9ACTN|nr:alpha-1,2-fucosyltransferase [Nocardioides potassii]MCF6376281.1 alpha-1,2-fucosyltransferase [Nocardioides potassii]
MGNLLYFWLHADIQAAAGRDVRVLHNAHVAAWDPIWPELRPRFGADVVRRTDRLLNVPPTHFQQFGRDFSRSELDAFVRTRLLTPEFISLAPDPDPNLLVVNVRRGDYYSNDEYRARYAMDIARYVRRAVDLAAARASISHVAIVSDDPRWCLDHLDFLGGLGPVRIVSGDPADHLAFLSSARHLVLANSTFSYWGAYLAGVRSDSPTVVAPAFHAVDINDGYAWQLDPIWHMIDTR